ncbi:MAG: FAD-dependent oxidoreductase [Candidatus Nanohaloarchaea archaeon]
MKDVIVIGGGVAGLQAAVFTAKAGEETLVLDTDESLVYSTSNIQNLVGHDSIGGQELLKKAREKLSDFDGEHREEEVESLEKDGDTFRVETGENSYQAEYVVLASAGMTDYIDIEEVDFEEGKEGPYWMDQHVVTDGDNCVLEGLYAAGLINYWVYQTSFAIGDGAKAAVNLLSDKYGEPYQDHDT